MKAAAVLARLLLCLALVAGGGVASALAQTYSPDLKQKAEQGDAEAQYQLGQAYHRAMGVNRDVVKWYRLAAEQSHVKAQIALGDAYYYGRDVYDDTEKAYIWYLLSGSDIEVARARKIIIFNHTKITDELKKLPPALQKKANSTAGLEKINYWAGVTYEGGVGVLPNYKEAARLYRLSAKQGFVLAQYALGSMYLDGRGVARDYGEAYIWFALAALNDDDEIKEESTKSRQVAEEKLTSDKLNQAQAEATRRLEEIKKNQVAAQ